MKALLTLILFASLLQAQDFVKKDDTKHTVAGVVAYVSCLASSDALDFNHKWCVPFVLAVGVTKEVADHYGTGVSEYKDVLTTVAPAVLIHYSWEWKGL